MYPAGFEPAIPASERPQTDASDRAATVLALPSNDKLQYKQTAALYPTAVTDRTPGNAQQVTLSLYAIQTPVYFGVTISNNTELLCLLPNNTSGNRTTTPLGTTK